jgi:hypothetical protein
VHEGALNQTYYTDNSDVGGTVLPSGYKTGAFCGLLN